ncbi:unnamed protein product [Rodentolepis nana]|uniref:DNA polymerase eta n=1 Tax=Rodentolepis nana TaxID=102285 RepID=A0A0R3T3C9_RODNA|nr:unnamed protein product [Rodentolepis nana]
MDRIVLLIDMDCFYVQVEQKLRPETIGLPCAVVQYTSLTAAAIIAVSYEARAKGVSRNSNGDMAKKICPDIVLLQVPTKRGKADLTKYREASAEVIKSISKFTSKIERASIDEAYIDATDLLDGVAYDSEICLEKSNLVIDPDSIHIESKLSSSSPPFSLPLSEIEGETKVFDNLCDGTKLKKALLLAQRIKEQIRRDTGFQCSIGVAANRMLAKLSCSLNKPDKITIVPLESTQHLMNFTKVKKVPGLGGKLGNDLIRRYGLEYMGGLVNKPLSRLIEDYGDKTGNWLYELCRGRDYQSVSVRTLVKSIGCSKHFIGKAALKADEEIRHWLTSLSGELVERIAVDRANHNRIPSSLSVGVRAEQMNFKSTSLQPSVLTSILPRTEESEETCTAELTVAKKIADIAFGVVRNIAGSNPINNITLAAGKFKPDHGFLCGNVKKLLSEQQSKQSNGEQEQTEAEAEILVKNQGVKRESFFRKFIEKEEPPKRESFFHRYIEPMEEGVPSTSKSPNYFVQHDSTMDTILCEECGLQVPVHVMPEHSDFHFARKLQAEWTKENSQPAPQNRPSSMNGKSIRGSKKKGRGVKSKSDVRNAKIDAFFVKKN